MRRIGLIGEQASLRPSPKGKGDKVRDEGLEIRGG